jgi:hypothetical protein
VQAVRDSCAYYLIKHSPRSFLSKDDLSEGESDRKSRRDPSKLVILVGTVAVSFFIALPIYLAAWAQATARRPEAGRSRRASVPLACDTRRLA